MSTFTHASFQYARALLDESSPGGGDVLGRDDLFVALGVPSALIPYLSAVRAPRSVMPEGLAVETLRWLRGQPLACMDDVFECVRLTQTGPQALDFAVSDPWLRYVLGVWMLIAARSASETVGDYLERFDTSESDEAARAYMTTDTDRPWALYMAGAWVLDRAGLEGIWWALQTPETDAARNASKAVFDELWPSIWGCTQAWSEHVQACCYENHYGNTDRLNISELVASDDHDASAEWCQEIFGRYPEPKFYACSMRTNLPYSAVYLPGNHSPVWVQRYISWLAAMCDATARKVAGLPEAPKRLPCLRGSDPETAQVIAFGKQMMRLSDEEIGEH